MPFPILFGTTVTTVLHYRADCDKLVNHTFHYDTRQEAQLTQRDREHTGS